MRSRPVQKAQVLSAIAGVMLFASSAHAYQTQRSFDQAESRAPDGRITVEASKIHVIKCDGPSENGREYYVYQYINRAGFRAISPPNWGSPIGGRDFSTFEEAAKAACAEAVSPPPPAGPATDAQTGRRRAVNEQVSVKYGDVWYVATIIEVDAAQNKVKIHYDGWGSEWDEWVTPDRVRDRQ
jgi:hypothetical protein